MMKRQEKRWCSGFHKHEGAKIHIREANVCEDASGITVKYSISVAEKTDVLWFHFSPEYKDVISYEVVDGVIVMLLPFALRGGYQIISDIPISEQLWFQITQQLIPQLALTSPDIWPTEINAPLAHPAFSPNKVATAMSCGVDSFTTFYQFTSDMPEEQWKVNLLTFFENGAHHSGVIGHSSQENAVYRSQLEHVRHFCDSIRYPLLNVSSNLDSFLCEVFWKDSYHYTHAFRNAGFVLLLQKLIRVYYYAGAHDLTYFSASLWEDTEYYEKWLLPNLSTACTHFFSVSTSLNRIEKTQFISKHAETHDHLLVCYAGGENCGKCSKCIRQLLTLDYLGKLDLYKGSFTISDYLVNTSSFECQLLAFRREDPFLEEVYQTALENGVRFSIHKRCRALLYRLSLRINGAKNKLRHMLRRLLQKRAKS
jgi:bacterioferritin-associated ferredoxin